MVQISALAYVFFVVLGLVIAVVQTYREKETWGSLLIMVFLSFIPILNIVTAILFFEDLASKSNFLKKKVF